jgi:DNA-directed RNA polymerase specialized sigma24 family protein
MNSNNPATRDAGQHDALEANVMHAIGVGPLFRKAYLLCDIQGLTIDDAAGILGISPSAVSIRLDRARRAMSAFLLAAFRERNPE